MSFLSNSVKRGANLATSNVNLSESIGRRYKDENQYKGLATNTMANNIGPQNRTMTQGLSDLTNIIKNSRGSHHSDEMPEKSSSVANSAEHKLDEISRTLQEILCELRIKLKEKAKKIFREACHVDIDKENNSSDVDMKFKNLKQLILYLSRTRAKLKEELDQRNEGNSNAASEYEGLIQKLEADIRGHIRIEQQLKLYAENTQSKLDDLEKEQKKFLIEQNSKLEGFTIKNKNLRVEVSRKQTEIDMIRLSIEEKREQIEKLTNGENETDHLIKKNDDTAQKMAPRRENILDKNKFIGGLKGSTSDIEQNKLSVQEIFSESRNSFEGAGRKKQTPDGGLKTKDIVKKNPDDEQENHKEKKLIKMLQKQLEQKDHEIKSLQKKIQEFSKVEESPPLKENALGIKKGISPPSSKVSSSKINSNSSSNTNSKCTGGKSKNEAPAYQMRNKSSRDVIEDFTKSFAEKKPLVNNLIGRDPSPLKKYRAPEARPTSSKKETETNRSTSVDTNSKHYRQTKTKTLKEDSNKGKALIDLDKDGGLKVHRTTKQNSNFYLNNNI